MCSRPILKHLPRLEPCYGGADPNDWSLVDPSALSSSTSSSATPASPSLGLLPFASCSSAHLYSPHVHFPPTPRLISSTYPTHSPSTYDRAPIVVERNVCALPERGTRVRHTPHSTRSRTRSPKGSYFHPRAYEACEWEVEDNASALPSSAVPPLLPDLSPPSSESDSEDCPSPLDGMPPPPGPTVDTGKTAPFLPGLPSPTPTPDELYSRAMLSAYLAEELMVCRSRSRSGKMKMREKVGRFDGCQYAVTFADEPEGCLGGF